MNYAIQLLEKERDSFETILDEWKKGQHPEAEKDRIKKLKSLNDAIELITGKSETIQFTKMEISSYKKELEFPFL